MSQPKAGRSQRLLSCPHHGLTGDVGRGERRIHSPAKKGRDPANSLPGGAAVPAKCRAKRRAGGKLRDRDQPHRGNGHRGAQGPRACRSRGGRSVATGSTRSAPHH